MHVCYLCVKRACKFKIVGISLIQIILLLDHTLPLSLLGFLDALEQLLLPLFLKVLPLRNAFLLI